MKELALAVTKVQANLPTINKNKTAKVPIKNGGQYSYKYSDLETVSDAIMPLLSQNGLAWITMPTMHEGDFVLACTLLHVSGEQLQGFYPLGAPNQPPQTIGSAITYARRYALCAAVGVVPEEDDDGQRAMEDRPSGTRAKKPNSRPRTQGSTQQRHVDETTGEVLRPLQDEIGELSQNERIALEDQRKSANFPAVEQLPGGAEKQFRKWIAELKSARTSV